MIRFVVMMPLSHSRAPCNFTDSHAAESFDATLELGAWDRATHLACFVIESPDAGAARLLQGRSRYLGAFISNRAHRSGLRDRAAAVLAGDWSNR